MNIMVFWHAYIKCFIESTMYHIAGKFGGEFNLAILADRHTAKL